MIDCPTENTLIALLDGTLSLRRRDGVVQHLRGCLDCTEVMLHSARRALPPGSSVDVMSDSRMRALVLTWSNRQGSRKECLSWSPPTQIDEYRLDEMIGHGGMGRVYRGYDTRLDRFVAIKFIAAMDPDSETCERFITEARALARMQHPNVVACYRAGEWAGRPYLVSEYVNGISLAQLPKPVTIEQACAIGLELACGLSAAHQRGVLHRDIKPANVMLDSTGQAKLVDFGLATLTDTVSTALREHTEGCASLLASRRLGLDQPQGRFVAVRGGHSAPSEQETPTIAGTPAFMAPEIWQGAAATQRSDVYSLGVVLYELCSGRLPFTASSTSTLRRIVLTESVPPMLGNQGVASPLETVVMRCLEKDPNRRFESAESVLTALRNFSTNRLTEDSASDKAVPHGFIHEAVDAAWRRFTRLGLAGGLYTVVLVTLLLLRTETRGMRVRMLSYLRATVERAGSQLGGLQADHTAIDLPPDAGSFPAETSRRKESPPGLWPVPAERAAAAGPTVGSQPYVLAKHPPTAPTHASGAQRPYSKARQPKVTLREHRERGTVQQGSIPSVRGNDVHQELEYEE